MSGPSWWWWDAYLGLVAAVVAVATLVADDHEWWRRLVAVGAIAAMVALHVLVSRPLIRRSSRGTAALLVLVAQVALFAIAVAAVPFTTWLLFAVIPMLFEMAELRTAVALVVVANLVPVAVTARESPESLRTQLVIAVVTGAAGIWLGLTIVRMVRQSVERARLIEELEASRAEVARLSHAAGVAEERTRLAGEIHDTLAQGFTSIITLLQAADPKLRDERLALAVRTARENLAESRALVAALAPAALGSGSLTEAVRRQAARFAEESGVQATVRITGDERPLPTRAEVVLLRGAQEALTNIRRHAGAREATVLLAYGSGTVRLVVRDDGRGFDPAVAAGFGLAGMRARVEQVAGTMTVRSEPGTGSTIELEVPA